MTSRGAAALASRAVPVGGELAQFDYVLSAGRIAQEPAGPRDSARLLLLDRQSGAIGDARVRDLGCFLRAGDCLVVNDTRVLPARLLGRIEATARDVELLLLHPVDAEWAALLRPARRCPVG